MNRLELLLEESEERIIPTQIVIRGKISDKKKDIFDDISAGKTRDCVHACMQSDVPSLYYDAAVHGIRSLLLESGLNPYICSWRHFFVAKGTSSDPDLFAESALTENDCGFGNQLSAERLSIALDSQSFPPGDHLKFFITSQDLAKKSGFEDDAPFIYGAGIYPNTIVSTARIGCILSESGNRQDQRGLIRVIFACASAAYLAEALGVSKCENQKCVCSIPENPKNLYDVSMRISYSGKLLCDRCSSSTKKNGLKILI